MMVRKVVLVLCLVAVQLFVIDSAAVAGCSTVYVTQYVDGVAVVQAIEECEDDVVEAGSGSDAEETEPAGTDVGCVQTAVTFGLDPDEVCNPADDEPGKVLTTGMIASAFRQVPLPPSELIIQPPNGRTLVNFETNFYTETEEFTRTLTLLGQRVELRVWPAEFGWRFGDGEELWTAEAGAPYPDLEVTHNYLEKGDVSPRVDTTYAAEFRVGGGPWGPVPGTVTIPGASVGLEVVEASPILVG